MARGQGEVEKMVLMGHVFSRNAENSTPKYSDLVHICVQALAPRGTLSSGGGDETRSFIIEGGCCVLLPKLRSFRPIFVTRSYVAKYCRAVPRNNYAFYPLLPSPIFAWRR